MNSELREIVEIKDAMVNKFISEDNDFWNETEDKDSINKFLF